jgi:hypothetical protein
MSVEYFEDQRREMVAAIRAITEDVSAEVGKPALDERVLRAMAKVFGLSARSADGDHRGPRRHRDPIEPRSLLDAAVTRLYIGAMPNLYAVVPTKTTPSWEMVEVDDDLRPPAGASRVHEKFWDAWAELCHKNSLETDNT